MDWTYDNAKKWAEDSKSSNHDAAVIYLDTHNEFGAKPNVSKWFDYCEISDIHPYVVGSHMPATLMEDQVLRNRMGLELNEAKRRIGKGYYNQSIKTRNEQRLAKDYGYEYYKWKQSLSPDEQKQIELASRGISDTRVKERAPLMIGDIRHSIQTFLVDITLLRQQVRKADISNIPVQSQSKARLQEEGKKAVAHIPGSVWVGRLKVRLNEAYRIMDWEDTFVRESRDALNAIFRKPMRAPALGGMRMNSVAKEKDEKKLIDLSSDFKNVGKSLGL